MQDKPTDRDGARGHALVSEKTTECEFVLLRFENPQHDFPRAIEYEGTSLDSLTAKVYGEIGSGEPAFVLRFARRAC